MSKLNNVKAINEMIRGEHRTQTRKSKGFEEKNISREIGDIWTDKNGQKWEQKNGYKVKLSRLNKIRSIAQPDLCPSCNKVAKKFDKQFIAKEGKCYDCIVAHETLLHCEGVTTKKPIYEQWENKKVRANVESFLKDAKKDVEMLKARFTKTEFVNSDGTIDKWKLPESVESIESSLDKQFDKFKDELLKKLERGKNNDNVKDTTTE
tara:strand:- start:852 stop:1472 length:621 start_codon:yes stop_codon:yes gene_type:complete